MGRISENLVEKTGPPSTPVPFDIVQGERLVKDCVFVEESVDGVDVPFDITGWSIAATAQFYTATVKGHYPDYQFSNWQEDTTKSQRALAVAIATQTGDGVGRFSVTLPSDLWPDPITIDTQENVPVGPIWVGVDDQTELEEPRWLVVIRRGIIHPVGHRPWQAEWVSGKQYGRGDITLRTTTPLTDSRVVMCMVPNNDAVFTPSKWLDLSLP